MELGALPASHRFSDRHEAGRALAERLREFAGRDDVVVLGLPRGGVPVAYEVARALQAPLDVVPVRRVAIAAHAGCIVGAVAGDDVFVRDEQIVRWYRVPEDVVEQSARAARSELERRRRAYRGLRFPTPLEGRVVILVDDGLTTGVTMAAAAMWMRRRRPARLIAAVPVAAPRVCRTLDYCVDAVVAAVVPDVFHGIARSYEQFAATSDDEVTRLLAASSRDLRRVRSRTALHGHGPRKDAFPTRGNRAVALHAAARDADATPRLRAV